jgi:hypothetical protein
MHNFFSSLLNVALHVLHGLSVNHQEFKTVHTVSGICHTEIQYDIELMLYVQTWTPDDGRIGRPKHVE